MGLVCAFGCVSGLRACFFVSRFLVQVADIFQKFSKSFQNLVLFLQEFRKFCFEFCVARPGCEEGGRAGGWEQGLICDAPFVNDARSFRGGLHFQFVFHDSLGLITFLVILKFCDCFSVAIGVFGGATI